ncbi:hypothetical protein [Alteriqipengyuania sp.]|uniref:hypothetical protein n=1 Tax=Alteriqipengyuania sp. TaxID=2800692 RepID=UPI003518739D
MPEQAQPKRTFGKAVLVTILATAALVALNPPSADGVHTGSPLVLQTTELA